MIFKKPSNKDGTVHVKQPIFLIPSSIVAKIILSIVSIVCYLSPKTDVTYLGAFVNRRYRECHNILEKEKKHSQKTYHQETVTLALAAIDRFRKYERIIPKLIDNSIKERRATYPKAVHVISRVIYLIVKQSIAFRGQGEELVDSKSDNKPDNVLCFYRSCTLLSSSQGHLEEPFQKNITYLSPTSHIEMTDIIGKNIIQATLLDGVKESGMH